MIRDIRQQIRSRYARSPFAFERNMEQPATESSPNSEDESALKISTANTFENGFCKVCKRMHFQNFKRCTCQGPLSKAELEAIILSFEQQEEKGLKRASENEDSKGCRCFHSKCVKLYCICFNNGKYCAEGCACRDCYNKTDNEDMIRDIQQQIWSRYARSPFAFERNMEQPATESSPNSEES